MNDFNPPPPQTIRKKSINIGSIVDLQHEHSGLNGFISGTQCWYRAFGDLNREMVVPTLSNSPIGHKILSALETPSEEDALTSGSEILIRSVWQNPTWPAYKIWQYLGVWEGDNNAHYYHIDDRFAKYSKWIIKKVVGEKFSANGDKIYSGDRVQIKAIQQNKWLANSVSKHKAEHHPQGLSDSSDSKRVTWVIWSQGSASK